MEVSFWKDRWEQNQIGFHQRVVNPYLDQHWSAVANDKGRVFVPLCGKSTDLIWLVEQGYSVVGVECSRLAVNSFFTENNLDDDQSSIGSFSVHATNEITLFQGDYFDLNLDNLTNVQYVFDRASLVALPEEMRLKYVQHMSQLLGKGVRILLVTLEYNQACMQGPPFSVDENEVNALYGHDFSIKKLFQHDIIQNEARFKAMGLDALIETVFCLEKL